MIAKQLHYVPARNIYWISSQGYCDSKKYLMLFLHILSALQHCHRLRTKALSLVGPALFVLPMLTEGPSSTNVLGLPSLCCWIPFPGQPQQRKWHQAHLFAPSSNKILRARSPSAYRCSGSRGHCLLRSPSLFYGCMAQPCAQCRPGWCSVLHRYCQEGERTHWLSQNILITACLLRVQNCKQPELFSWLLYLLLY